MKKTKIYRASMAAGLAIFLAAGFDLSPASAETQSQLNAKLGSIKEKQINNQSDLKASKQKLSQNKNKQNDVLTEIVQSENKINSMNSQISKKRADVGQNQATVAQLKTQVGIIEKRIDQRGKLLDRRIRSIYINGGAVSYIEVLLGSNSFGNFLDRLLAVKTITDHDAGIIAAQQKDQAARQVKQNVIQKKLEQTKQDLASLNTLNQGLIQEKSKQTGLLSQLKKQASDINDTVMNKNEEAGILQAQAAVINRQISNLKKEEEARKAAAAQTKSVSSGGSAGSGTVQTSGSSNGGSTDSGTAQALQSPNPVHGNFIKPAAGVISSGFGYRSFDHEFHPGIDIANSTGTPVYAAADGIVFRAYQSSSYGNCVMISHFIGGRTYTTVYAHLSSYNVSDGQTVSQGQLIGLMGATGEAFGSHLHFELYIGPWTPPPHNGAVDPMQYISQ
ncbi:peptidase M23 [Sporolactobacillus shoreae]|uniref:Peptidase M23 n=1 Tax=Sporolactobacillus shoreae TaxID=1465501 RepID=A0A4Z0GL08_9BACL|nr:peptidoglycan DD-metalloendopeptidase family protein [Sporolactobacillus shoreae]TGA96724.1 peptidase M23 [Sporolactobacillus shoreae]